MSKYRGIMQENYHPADLPDKDIWEIAHITFGVKKITDFNVPRGFSDEIAPQWYRQLNSDQRDQLWDAQEAYVKKLLAWISNLGVVKAFIKGAEEERERTALSPFNVPEEGKFEWNEALIGILPEMNIQNLYLESADGSALIIYESDTETVFIKDANHTLPQALREPQIQN